MISSNKTNQIKDLQSEKIKVLKKEVESLQATERLLMFMDWQNLYCENNHPSKSSYKTNVILTEILVIVFRNGKGVLQFVWKHKIAFPGKVILSKKNEAEAITIPIIQGVLQTIVLKTAL